MKKTTKYDPEDIESLMRHKSFDELYEEEREFVLRFIDSKEEYNSMRSTLTKIIRAKDSGSHLEPKNEIKESLLEQFGQEKKKGFVIWLNAVFPFLKSENSGFDWKPVMQVGLAGLILLLGTGIFLWNSDDSSIAEVIQDKEVKKTEKKSKEIDKTEETKEIKAIEKSSNSESDDAGSPTSIEESEIQVLEDSELTEDLRDEVLDNSYEDALSDDLLDFDVEEEETPTKDEAVELDFSSIKVEDESSDILVTETQTTALSSTYTYSPTYQTEVIQAEESAVSEKKYIVSAKSISEQKNDLSQINTPLKNDQDLIEFLYTAP